MVQWDKVIGFKTCNHIRENFPGCTKSVFVLAPGGVVTLFGHLQTSAINLAFLVKPCHLPRNPESVICCDLGTASPLHQCSVRRWHMMDFRIVLFPSPDCRDCLGMLAGPWQAEPPLCFTLINIQLCPQNPSWAVTTPPPPHTFFFFFINVDDAAAAGSCSWLWWWWRWLWWWLIGGSKVDREPFIEIWCIQ